MTVPVTTGIGALTARVRVWPYVRRSATFTPVFGAITGVGRSVLRGERVIWPATAAGLVAAGASLTVRGIHPDLNVAVALASMTTFLFGVLLAFTIARMRERLTLVRELMSKGNASLQSIHQMMAVFAEPDRSRSGTSSTRSSRARSTTGSPTTTGRRRPTSHWWRPSTRSTRGTRQEEVLYRKLVEQCIQMTTDRALVETTTGQSVMPVEWTGMLLLLGMIVALLIVMPGGTVWGALVAGALTGTLVTLLIVLRQLDRLTWHEQASIWEPTTRLFRSMDLNPYVPRPVIDAGRYRRSAGSGSSTTRIPIPTGHERW